MKEKRFPSIIGLIILIAILFAGVYLSLRSTSLSSKASTTCKPINYQITNLTYSSFDFSFTTASSCLSTLAVNGKTYSDSSTSSNTHYFKITNLSPKTSYLFVLTSGAETYALNDFQVTTASQPNSSVPSSNLAWGKVIDSNKKPVVGAIIYLTIPGAQALSAFSNTNGNWNISFATSFNDNKDNWFTLSDNQEEDIIVYSPDGKLTQLTNQTDNNDPVPDIIIGQNYFSITPTSTPVDSLLGAGSVDSSSATSLSITSPAESETISTLKPDIFGKGPNNSVFKLSLDNATAVNVGVGVSGIWHWSPSTNLSIGPHKIVATYQNQTITRNFSVSQNSSLAFTASSSATTPTPSTIPTTSLTSTPTPSPEVTNVPTVRTAKISTTSALYKTGDSLPTYLLVIIAISLFSVSLYYFRR